MFKLPLFPLNTVLFPSMPLSLHIFEDRYKQMMLECLDKRQPFGVVLIQSGDEAFGPLAEPYKIGCTAQITQVQKLNEGRMNVIAVGHERFQVLSLEYTLPYLVGVVNTVPLSNNDPAALRRESKVLRLWLKRYLVTQAKADNLQFDLKQLPHEPLALVYLAAFLLQIPPQRKQELLASDNALALATSVLSIYRREVTLIKALLSEEKVDSQGDFSLN
jgi:uncharacterized protein